MALKSMSIEKLVALKDQIEAMLSSKVLEQRRALESELAKLGRFQGGKSGSKVARGFGARGAVAPKYRNPENPAETWAGRGLKPRWLAAAIKSGISLAGLWPIFAARKRPLCRYFQCRREFSHGPGRVRDPLKIRCTPIFWDISRIRPFEKWPKSS